jgi:hypothetical protein
VILLILQKPIEHVTSTTIWIGLSTIAVAVLLQTAYTVVFSSKAKLGTLQFRIGLFLILRNSLPSLSYIMSSYVYSVFEKSPLVLQVLSLLDMGISTLACWLYGKLFSTWSSPRQQLIRLMAGTTIFAAIASLGNLVLFRMLQQRPNSGNESGRWIVKVTVVIAVRCVMGLADQWNFLPDLVLATTSINPSTQSEQSESSTLTSENDANKEENGCGVLPDESFPIKITQAEQSEFASSRTRVTTRVGLEYGAFISCIDLGGQLGALMVGPILNLIGTSRENHWSHLDWLLELNSLWILLSLLFLLLLR